MSTVLKYKKNGFKAGQQRCAEVISVVKAADKNEDKIQIVTTVYPEYDWVKQVLGNRAKDAEITLLICDGEALAAEDKEKIEESDLFVYVGGESDAWAEEIADNSDVKTINLMEVLGKDAKEDDEHVWLFVENAKVICSEIADTLGEIDTEHATDYKTYLSAYMEKLNALDYEFKASVNGVIGKELAVENAEACSNLLDDYGVNYVDAEDASARQPITTLNTMEEITALAKDMGVTVEEINMRRAALHEFNPMMGHRGCRLAVTYPEIAKMQTRAVMEAAIEVKQEKGYDIVPEIMIPLVGEKKELAYVKEVVVQTAEKVKAYYESDIQYKVGTMIEIPRAALLADEIAEEAEFFSFGTNDLTQMTFGFSRDDAGKFLESYYENKIYESDPFAKLDQKGVGQLIEMAAKKGKATRPDIHLGICGEHGGDPSSVEFCYRAGLDYVSCSPFRVPIARLAAAQAVLKDK